jgi:hypothetical protein
MIASLSRKFAIPVVIYAALLALSAAQVRAQSATPAAPPLSAEQLAKIQKLIDEKHRDATIDPKVAKMLGLGNTGKSVVALQVAVVDNDKSVHHVFDRLKDGSGFLVGRRTAEGFAVYRLGSDLAPIANVLWRKDGDKVALHNADTASILRHELELWAQFANRLK